MKKSRKKVKFYTLDKFMITLIVLLVVAMPVLIVYSKSTLSESNIELERIKRKIEKQESINESVSMKINELASLSNIQDVAKEKGLDYNNDNIIVVK
ncbi:MAG: cell division protein FtsL [Tenericutes bacterium]|nr:cell division protein FtsL [Mycoplasmatota bacterium]MDO4341394.1 cell division protein FtsL [bacterium]